MRTSIILDDELGERLRRQARREGINPHKNQITATICAYVAAWKKETRGN